MRRRTIGWGLGLLGIAAFAASATPVFGADSGTVNAEVEVATPCISVSTPSVDYGAAAFTTPTSLSFAQGSPNMSITNCGSSPQTLFGRATNATGTSATWTLIAGTALADPCAGGSPPDRFQVQTFRPSSPSFFVPLPPDNANLINQPAGDVLELDSRVVMPCVGSSGAGQTMRFDIIYTATF